MAKVGSRKSAAAARRIDPDLDGRPYAYLTSAPVMAACAVHDQAWIESERRWGVEVLPNLVPPDMAAKFQSAREKFNVALDVGAAQLVADHAAVVVRGLAALEKAALEAGHKPLQIGAHWPATDDNGKKWLFVQHDTDARAAAADPRWSGYKIFSIQEVMRVCSERGMEAVLKIKELYAGATVASVREPLPKSGDAIPF